MDANGRNGVVAVMVLLPVIATLAAMFFMVHKKCNTAAEIATIV